MDDYTRDIVRLQDFYFAMLFGDGLPPAREDGIRDYMLCHNHDDEWPRDVILSFVRVPMLADPTYVIRLCPDANPENEVWHIADAHQIFSAGQDALAFWHRRPTRREHDDTYMD